VGRRLDAYVMAQRFRGQSIAEFWSLINKIARNSIVEKARIVASLRAVEGEDGPVARRLLERIRDADSESSGQADLLIDRLLDLLPDPMDRDIATLWMLGVPHAEIAARLEMSELNVRKKWQRIREHLRAEIEEGRS
jgi:DNA-directed RNA polymerase specialized sigma24 family protein